MSILSKGMEMPEKCGDCRMMVDGWCYAIGDGYGVRQDSMVRKPSWCPLEEVQTHDKRTETHACDLIDRQAAIDALKQQADTMSGWSERYAEQRKGVLTAVNIVEDLPSAQPTLYGYNIEHLAYIARVMEKEGITAEVAVNTFLDVGHAVKMILDEARESIKERIWMI